MMNVRAAILKLLDSYPVPEILGHLAHELDRDAAHMETVGAPKRAAYLRREAALLRETITKHAEIPY